MPYTHTHISLARLSLSPRTLWTNFPPPPRKRDRQRGGSTEIGKGKEKEKEEAHLAATHDAFVLVVAKGALVADAHQGRGPHVAVADGALAVALVAEAADGDAGLLAAHDEIAGWCVCLLAFFWSLWFCCFLGGGGERGVCGCGVDLRMVARHCCYM